MHHFCRKEQAGDKEALNLVLLLCFLQNFFQFIKKKLIRVNRLDSFSVKSPYFAPIESFFLVKSQNQNTRKKVFFFFFLGDQARFRVFSNVLFI